MCCGRVVLRSAELPRSGSSREAAECIRGVSRREQTGESSSREYHSLLHFNMWHRFSLNTGHYRILAVLWTVGIVTVCSLPTESLPEVQPALSLDKLVHFGLFAVFGALWMRGLCPPERDGLGQCLRRRGLALFVTGGVFAGGVEVYQHLAPLRRLGDPYDALANVLGLFFALLFYYLYHK